MARFNFWGAVDLASLHRKVVGSVFFFAPVSSVSQRASGADSRMRQFWHPPIFVFPGFDHKVGLSLFLLFDFSLVTGRVHIEDFSEILIYFSSAERRLEFAL